MTVKITGFLVPIPDLQKWDHRRGALESSLLICAQDDSYPQAHLGPPWPIRENPEEIKNLDSMVSIKWCHPPYLHVISQGFPGSWNSSQCVPCLSLLQTDRPLLNDDEYLENYFVLAIFLPRIPFHFVPLLDLDSEATDLQVISNYSEMAFQCK